MNQAVLLQKIGQKILSKLRMDIFTHIENLSHEQLNNIPVGKLVTRVTNDTNAISMMFTNVLVTLVKNSMVLCGVMVSMLAVNYSLTLILLCFVPFVATVYLEENKPLEKISVKTLPYPGFPTDMNPQMCVLLCLANVL